MTIGPFTTYAPPGVYTQTIVEPVVLQLLGGLRVPVLIGTAQETLTQTDFEMIRGSSSVADTPIFNEDVSGRWIVSGTNQNPVIGSQDGTLFKFKVRNYPIVDGDGLGRTTFDVTKISVTVNGEATVVSQVDGTNGVITLLTAPRSTDTVLISYFFHRKDTRITDNVSDQVTEDAASLVAPKAETYEITTGTNDILTVYVNDATASNSVTLTAGIRSATDIANDINGAGVTGLTATVHVDNQGLNHLRLNAQGNILVGSGTANGILGFNPGDYTNRTRVFRTYQGPIVDGSDGGITTTEPSKVTVLVNGVQVVASEVDGTNRLVTLPTAPVPGAIVTIEYWFNTWQDTFDYLPNSNIVTMGNVGISPGRRDYLNGPDFVVVNENDQSKILWGTAWQVVSGEVTGSTPLDSTQVTAMLVDDRMYAVELDRYVDTTTNTVSSTQFELPLIATTGNGRDTPLGTSVYQTVTNSRIDLPTNRPDLVIVHTGKTPRDALSRPPVTVLEVNISNNTIVLQDTVPADYNAYATFWYNRTVDDNYTLTCQTPGASGIGKFTVTSELNNDVNLYSVIFGTKNALPQTVQWPSGVEKITDAIHYGGQPVPETVTITFDSTLLPNTHASFSNALPEPYDLYTTYSDQFGGIRIDGASAFSVDLNTAFAAQLLGSPVSGTLPAAITTTDELVLEIDGVILNINETTVTAAAGTWSTVTTLAGVVTAINAVIDADVQVHPDGSGTFASTAANSLASVVTYGTQSILKIAGRNVQTSTNGLESQVKVLTPTTVGQVDISATLGFTPNQESLGSWDGLNQPAEIISSVDAPYLITASVDDSFLFNIDGQDYQATIPSGSAVTQGQVVDAINAGYLDTAPAADQATALAQAIVVANSLATNYGGHQALATWHVLADAANNVTAPVATDLSSLLTLLADIKAQFNAHIINTGGVYHNGSTDTTNTISAADPTTLEEAINFIWVLKNNFNSHLATAGTIHLLADATNVETNSNSQLVAIAGAGLYANKIILRSRVNTISSRVAISTLGTANTKLGFTAGDSASVNQPTASRLAAALNADATFAAAAVAWPVTTQGRGTFLQIDSLSAGIGSSITFTSVTGTVFTTDTGIGITPGVSGDIGEAATAGYTVSSSNPNGSSGTGVPGQTYTDAQTGLRFTVLPASAGDYADGGSFTLIVNSTFTADASIPSRAIPGLEFYVFNTLNVGVDSTAILSTFNKGGSEPAVGDVYYVSYNYAKSDISTALFRDLKKIQQNFGAPTPENPLSLGARLALLNGSVLLGLRQVLRAPNSAQASLQSYADAINEQKKPIEGSVKPDVLVALATDPEIFSLLNQHAVFMSAPRQEGERISIGGVAAGTTPLGVRAIAQGLQSELFILTYPDTFVISVTDQQGNTVEQLIDGSYAAAALAGSATNPAVDAATPWTRRQVLGFKRLGRILDPTEANQVAVSGVSIIERVDTGMRIRHGLTTRIDNVITRTPSVTLTIHYIQQSTRRTLDPYIGQKFTSTLIKSVESKLNGMFSGLIDKEIVTEVGGIAVTIDEDDPTIMRTSAIYVPVFPLEYIVSTFQVRIRL